MGLDELGQDTTDRFGVEEDDRRPVDASPDLARLLEAFGDQAHRLGLDVVDGIGKVMQAGPPLGDELSDRGARLAGRQQLQLDPARVEEGEVETVQVTAPDQAGREGRRVEGHRRIDVGYRDPDMVESFQHWPYCRLNSASSRRASGPAARPAPAVATSAASHPARASRPTRSSLSSTRRSERPATTQPPLNATTTEASRTPALGCPLP